jgi:hypothetical protein
MEDDDAEMADYGTDDADVDPNFDAKARTQQGSTVEIRSRQSFAGALREVPFKRLGLRTAGGTPNGQRLAWASSCTHRLCGARLCGRSAAQRSFTRSLPSYYYQYPGRPPAPLRSSSSIAPV